MRDDTIDLPQAHADEIFNVAAPPSDPELALEALLRLRPDVRPDAAWHRAPVPPTRAEPLSHGWWDASRWPRRSPVRTG
ncbi:MAG: hypothetical protein U0V73_08350 [Acidimicrobiia bacterium]